MHVCVYMLLCNLKYFQEQMEVVKLDYIILKLENTYFLSLKQKIIIIIIILTYFVAL